MGKRSSGGRAAAKSDKLTKGDKRDSKKSSRKKSTKDAGPAGVRGPDGGRTISERKITNGYLVTETGYSRGKYTERTTYTPNKPKIVITGAPKAGG